MLDRAGQSAAGIVDMPGRIVEQSKCIQLIAIDPRRPPDVRAELVLTMGQGISGTRLFREVERMGGVKQ